MNYGFIINNAINYLLQQLSCQSKTIVNFVYFKIELKYFSHTHAIFFTIDVEFGVDIFAIMFIAAII